MCWVGTCLVCLVLYQMIKKRGEMRFVTRHSQDSRRQLTTQMPSTNLAKPSQVVGFFVHLGVNQSRLGANTYMRCASVLMATALFE